MRGEVRREIGSMRTRERRNDISALEEQNDLIYYKLEATQCRNSTNTMADE